MSTLVHLQRKNTLAANWMFIQSEAKARSELRETDFRSAANF